MRKEVDKNYQLFTILLFKLEKSDFNWNAMKPKLVTGFDLTFH